MLNYLKHWLVNLLWPTKRKPAKPIQLPVSTIKEMTTPYELNGNTYFPPLTVNALVHGGTLAQREFFRNVLMLLRAVVISDEFQSKCLDRGKFTDSYIMPYQVYIDFMSGKDLYEDDPDREMDLDLNIYYKRNSTVGYTYANTRRQFINMRHFDITRYEDMAEAVGNIVHEYMHNLGYSHTRRWTKYRDDSVPYFYGHAAEAVALEFLRAGNDIKHFKEE